jgi:branched-chain amino acid transport system permease protein
MRRLSLTTRVKLGVLLFAIVLGVAAPYIVSPFVTALLTLGLVSGLFAMSIDLLSGYGGLVTLGQAGISATAAYGVGYIANNSDWGFLSQIAVGLLAGLIAAAVFAAMAMRANGVYFMMITLAQGMIVWGLSIRLYQVTGAENGLTGIERPSFLSRYWQYYWFVLAVVVVCSLLLFVVVRSPFGFAIKGMRESESRLQVLGYNPLIQKFYLFMVSGVFASISGLLLVYLNEFISPSAVTLAASAIGLLEAILGGFGTLVGPMIGAFIIVFIRNMVSTYLARWPTLIGIIFIVVVLYARGGIVGGISSFWYGWLDRRGLRPPHGEGDHPTVAALESPRTR